jgi:hypothetical protein
VPFEIPEDITALDDAALADALAKALEAAAEFNDVDDADLDDEKLNRLIALADFATAAREAQAERAAAATARAEKAAAARAALTGPEDEDEDDEDDEETPAAEEPAPASEVKEPVAAAATPKKAVVARLASKVAAPVDILPAKPTAVLTASADVPGFATGGRLEDLDTVGKALVARMKGLPTVRLGGAEGIQQRYSVANIDIGSTRTDGLIQTKHPDDDQALLTKASKEARLPGGSLTAAGGWCAPSETLYDLCSFESTDGLLDLPSITASRGGIRYTKGPSFASIFNTAGLGWFLTEAQVIAGAPPKTCVEVSCPPFTEVRLDAVGICITAPLLTEAAYPELVRRFTEGALIAQQHKVDGYVLSKIDAASTSYTLQGTGVTSIDGLAQIEFAVMHQRQLERMSFNQSFELLLPYWYKAAVRADLSRRTGVDLINVGDAQIESYFTARGVRVQWLYNLDPLDPATGDIPTTATAYLYPAGAFVKATTDVISLDAVYDSTLLKQNTYTALFAESGVAVVNTCGDPIKFEINACASGQTGAADLTDCLIGNVTP